MQLEAGMGHQRAPGGGGLVGGGVVADDMHGQLGGDLLVDAG
jgi:hypothetical protein